MIAKRPPGITARPTPTAPQADCGAEYLTLPGYRRGQAVPAFRTAPATLNCSLEPPQQWASERFPPPRFGVAAILRCGLHGASRSARQRRRNSMKTILFTACAAAILLVAGAASALEATGTVKSLSYDD